MCFMGSMGSLFAAKIENSRCLHFCDVAWFPFAQFSFRTHSFATLLTRVREVRTQVLGLVQQLFLRSAVPSRRPTAHIASPLVVPMEGSNPRLHILLSKPRWGICKPL